MTRFEKELSGALGEFWKKDAEKELAKVKEDLERGEITIDENGIAYNCIGRVLMDDMAEKVAHVTDRIDRAATEQARTAETKRKLARLRAEARPVSAEHLAEMRNAFGTGATVVNVLTGQVYKL